MAERNNIFISSVYRRLASVAGSLGNALDSRAAAQEILDFLAVFDGLKPAVLIGRGLDDERWIAGVLGIAAALELSIVDAPLREAGRPAADVPDWYADHLEETLAAGRAWYVAASEPVAKALRAMSRGDRYDVADEAWLLGYPECCVAAHYDRADAWHRLTVAVLGREAGGDEGAVLSMLRAGVAVRPVTDAEQRLYAAATGFAPSPFGSWNMCESCASNPDSPSARLAARYRDLAENVDPELAALLDPG